MPLTPLWSDRTSWHLSFTWSSWSSSRSFLPHSNIQELGRSHWLLEGDSVPEILQEEQRDALQPHTASEEPEKRSKPPNGHSDFLPCIEIILGFSYKITLEGLDQAVAQWTKPTPWHISGTTFALLEGSTCDLSSTHSRYELSCFPSLWFSFSCWEGMPKGKPPASVWEVRIVKSTGIKLILFFSDATGLLWCSTFASTELQAHKGALQAPELILHHC